MASYPYLYESKTRNTIIFYEKDLGLANDIEKVFQSPIRRPTNNNSGRSSPDGAFCCACLELLGGRLYTCHRCNSSFHSICHYPPLPPNRGKLDHSKWLCHRCQMEIKYDAITGARIFQNPQEREDVGNRCIIRYLINQNNANCSTPNLTNLSFAMKAINAREFSLDRLNVEDCYYNLPFDEAYNKDEQNQSHKPCFYCKKFVEKCMISCDFCSTPFCFDCLNPPIIALPNERFMCPLHIENFIDSYLVNSLRVTERIRLWKKYSNVSNPQTIFKEFCKKSRSDKELDQPKTTKQQLPAMRQWHRKRLRRKNAINRIETFQVNKSVIEAYARIYANEDNEINQQEQRIATNNEEIKLSPTKCTENVNEQEIDETTAAEILLNLFHSEEAAEPSYPQNFHPSLFNPKLPIYAALQILSGADLVETGRQNSLIPIQSLFVTLGVIQHQNSIDLREFTTCRALTNQQALIFFDRSKLAFEMVSANLILGKNGVELSHCKCLKPNPTLPQMDISRGIAPSSQSSVLWNGAVLRIGCLRLLFVGIGIL